MFAKTIVLSDAFLDMPLSARCLYFTLGMLADDDGFINNPKSVMRQSGASTDDLNLLMAKRFIIAFDSGVIVIKHWRIHNYIQKDRYKKSKYVEEKATLTIDEKGAYTECIQNVYKMDTQDRLGKDRLGKDNIEGGNENTAPTHEMVKTFCASENLIVNPDLFFNHYQSREWKYPSGQNVTDWKAELKKWDAQDREKKVVKHGFEGRKESINIEYADAKNCEV